MHLVGWNVLTKSRRMGGLGLREARNMNTSLLGKLIWSMTNQPEKIWAQLLKARYLTSMSLFHATLGSNSPYIWRGVVKAINILKDGFHLHLGSSHLSL